jgi:nitroreductase
MSMSFEEVIRTRRSVRAYRPDPVEQEKLDRILEAFRLAPSAANRQPYRLYVARNADTRARLGQAYSPEWFAAAPVILCICTIPEEAWHRGDRKSYADVDAAIAFEHIVLAAAAEGLGTCWIGAFNPQAVREALRLPGDEEPVAMTPLGYPDDEPGPVNRKPIEELVRVR